MAKCQQCGSSLAPGYSASVCLDCFWSPDLFTEPIPESEMESTIWLDSVLAGLARRPRLESRYELGELLNKGGQGEVFIAKDRWLLRKLALKRLPMVVEGTSHETDTQGFAPVLRFIQEAQIPSQFTHRGILPVFDLGLDEQGRLFYTTVLHKDHTLADVIEAFLKKESNAWPLARILESLITLSDTLAYAHSRGVIHRDVKPRNVLVGDFGDVYLVDWGSAHVQTASFLLGLEDGDLDTIQTNYRDYKLLDPVGSDTTARTGYPATFPYVPPEIALGIPDVSGQKLDVYALGVILYRVLSGKRPYEEAIASKDPRKKERVLKKGPPVSLKQLSNVKENLIPPELAAIGDTAMAYDPDERYTTVRDFARDLRAFLDGRVVLAYGKTGPWIELKKWILRNQAVAASLLAVFLASLLSLLFALDSARSTAETALARADEAVAQQGRLQAENRARQTRILNALRNAELARRSGRWDDSLANLAIAEETGYSDRIDLALKRLDLGYSKGDYALTEIQMAMLETEEVPEQSRALVTLRLAERALSGESTFTEGVSLARKAVDLGLGPADEAFAKALIAETTPEALDHFHTALELDPLYANAHRHAFGLELFLGRHEELQSHLRLFRALYPKDATADMIAAISALIHGRGEEGMEFLEKLDGAYERRLVAVLRDAYTIILQMLGDRDSLLGDSQQDPNQLTTLVTSLFGFWRSIAVKELKEQDSHVRLPSTPAMRHATRPIRQMFFTEQGGLKPLLSIINLLMNPTFKPELANALKESVEHHPEGLSLFLVSTLLLNTQVDSEAERESLMLEAIDYLEKAAHSSMMAPAVEPIIRYRAAEAQFYLFNRSGGRDRQARLSCLNHIRKVLADPETSRTEYRVYSEMAHELGDFETVGDLVRQWERRHGTSMESLKQRALYEEASGYFFQCLETVEKILELEPESEWGKQIRERVKNQIKAKGAEGITF